MKTSSLKLQPSAKFQATSAPRGWFVTGTDTGVGKTFVTALLLAELRKRGVQVAGFKPIACGAGGRADAKLFASLMDGKVAINEVNPIYLHKPLAPFVAARLEKSQIDLRRVRSSFQLLIAGHNFILVEGVGGWLVPIRPGYFVRELAQELNLPVLIVARPRLGTLNHTLLTVESVRAAGLRLAAIVLNDTTGARRGPAERTNAAALRALADLPVIEVPFCGEKPTTPSALQKMLARRKIRTAMNAIFGG